MRSPSGSGSFVLVMMPNIWKVTAPNQMPNAIARPPMTVSPGYFTSIRKPSFRSSDRPLNHAVPRPSRSVSRCCCTPPKVASARRLRFVVIELLLAHEPLRLHLDVEADLVVDPGLGGAWGEEAQARAGGVEPRHGMLRE